MHPSRIDGGRKRPGVRGHDPPGQPLPLQAERLHRGKDGMGGPCLMGRGGPVGSEVDQQYRRRHLSGSGDQVPGLGLALGRQVIDAGKIQRQTGRPRQRRLPDDPDIGRGVQDHADRACLELFDDLGHHVQP